MSLWQEIEDQCNALKHGNRDTIGLEGIRFLLRRLQPLSAMLQPESVHVGENHVDISFRVDNPKEFVRTMAEVGEW